jgi:hypothetical protein
VTAGVHGLTGVADAGAFLARLTRLDATAVVRLRRSGTRTALWARLPWDVLVTREVAGSGPVDVTVSAAELLAGLAGDDPDLPPLRDGQWRWPLPPAGGSAVEPVATAELSRLAQAAAGTLRTAATHGVAGRAVGQRALRDALLDHVALVITRSPGDAVEVPQRLVQAVFRMGFLGRPTDGGATDGNVARGNVAGGGVAGGPSVAGDRGPSPQVLISGRWLGISAPYGVAWLQPVKALTIMPIGNHPNG